ncbi:hypothetical protein E2C01_016366 [Portunus trituberculatus]|uniref:Uncharacterized protein n=1 Tax=Portunus trituberculatus TaxID=210409 RepID=A0A5B7DNX4_PORTR|nr:hypothetical protein [Portunus trituberculatus]
MGVTGGRKLTSLSKLWEAPPPPNPLYSKEQKSCKRGYTCNGLLTCDSYQAPLQIRRWLAEKNRSENTSTYLTRTCQGASKLSRGLASLEVKDKLIKVACQKMRRSAPVIGRGES